MTTLADMTPEQRQQCVGMWATNLNYTGDGESVGVIACVQHGCVWLIHTCLHGEWSVFSVDSVSPRPDLPRAWNPDGTPPAGQWDYRWLNDDGTPQYGPNERYWVGEWEDV